MKAKALVCLTPAESRRLIAKGVGALPEVRHALAHGRVIIAVGTTNTYVAEEILGQPMPRGPFVAGYVGPDGLWETAPEVRMNPVVLVKGERVDRRPREVLEEFEAGDVFIKGANAVDPTGAVGIFLGGAAGGTIGLAIGYLAGRGAHLVVPVGLMPLVGARVVTEIEAIAVLAGVEAIHVGSGGVGGAEGTVTLLLEGERDRVEAAFSLIRSLKGEPPFPLPPARKL